MEPNITGHSSHTIALRCKRIVCAAAFALLLVAVPAARAQNQNDHWGDIAVDYTYLRAGSSGNGGAFTADGGTLLGAYQLRQPLSIVGEIQLYTFRGQPAGTDGQMLTYMFGPELQLPIHGSRWSVAADALVGGGYLRGEQSGQVAHENCFTFDVGEGLDVRVRDRWSVELVKVEYLMTNFQRNNGLVGRQGDMRISAGFILNLRKQNKYHD